MVGSELSSSYFNGELLWGDDFSDSQIAEWYADEAEAFANLLNTCYQGAKTEYEFNALNIFHGYTKLPPKKIFNHVMGIGSAYGYEFLPIIENIKNLTIIEPGSQFESNQIFGKPVKYVKPQPNGILPFEDASFDLVTCFGVLHHIPNVTKTINEISRCLADEGYLILREPIISMGDWRLPRKGLTKRERGLPLNWAKECFSKAKMTVEYSSPVCFPLIDSVCSRLKGKGFNSKSYVRFDQFLSRVFLWNYAYHTKSLFRKLRPRAFFWVLKRQARTIGG